MASRYAQFVQARADAKRELKALIESWIDPEAAEPGTPRLPTDAERKQADTLENKIRGLTAEIERDERMRAAEAAAAESAVEVVADLAIEKPWASRPGAKDGLGQWALAIMRATVGQGLDPRLMRAAASGQSEAIGQDGGFAVPVEYAAGIEKNMWDQGQILSRVSERPLEGNAITFNVINETSRVDGSRRGGVLGYWVDEGTAPTVSQIKLAQVEMKLRKVAALGYMTEELQQDATALAAELQDAFTEELLFQVENRVINGVGATGPLGILNAPCLVSVTKETNQPAATINVDNLSKMWARLPARSKANAVWLGNVEIEPQLDVLSIAAGTGALEPRFVTYGPDGIMRIKGRPYINVEYCAALGTVGDLILADLSQYRVIRKAGGVETASSIHVRFLQGENTFRAIYRVDGQPMPRAAITPFKGNNTLSPFVALATRA